MASLGDTSELSREEIDEHYDKIGKRFVSKEMQRKQAAGELSSTATAEDNWYEDLWAFLGESDLPRNKVPTLGGAPLDMFSLFQRIVRRGGIQATIDARGFKALARELELPRTCTSAAFVLRQSYERFMYLYEQKFLFNRDVHQAGLLRQAVKTSVTFVPRPGQEPDVMPSGGGGVTRLSRTYGGPEYGGGSGGGSAGAGHGASIRAHIENGATVRSLGLSAMYGRGGRITKRALKEAMAPMAKAAAPSSGSIVPFSGATVPYAERVKEDVRRSVREARSSTAPSSSSLPPPPPPLLLPSFAENNPRERERLVLSLQCGIQSEAKWALATLNALCLGASGAAGTSKLELYATHYPGLLDALQLLLEEYLDDVERRRTRGLPAREESERSAGAHIGKLSPLELHGSAARRGDEAAQCNPSLLRYEAGLFNTRDPVAVERAERARLACNALRNMSFTSSNDAAVAAHAGLTAAALRVIRSSAVDAQCRLGLLDMWVNIASSIKLGDVEEHASSAQPNAVAGAGHGAEESGGAEEAVTGSGGESAFHARHAHAQARLPSPTPPPPSSLAAAAAAAPTGPRIDALDSIIELLDPTHSLASVDTMCKAAEILAQYAAALENERALVSRFDAMLPRLVDMLGAAVVVGRHAQPGDDLRVAIAALDVFSNVSAFDWPARARMASAPRLVERLVLLLRDAQRGSALAPRAALSLLNLAENPQNRRALLPFEERFVACAMTRSAVSDTVAGVLHELTGD